MKFRLCAKCIKRLKFDQKKKDEMVKKATEAKPEIKKVEEKIGKPVVKKTSRAKSSKK